MTQPEPEFSVPLDVEQIDSDGYRLTVEADGDARSAIAQRLGLATLDLLSAEIVVEPAGRGVFHVEGDLRASGEQVCVVSLEPVSFNLSAPFSGLCLPSDSPESQRDDFTLEDDETDVLAEVIDGLIDLGEIIVQQLALELDPFPRREGIEAVIGESQPENEKSPEDSPFAALAALKDTLK